MKKSEVIKKAEALNKKRPKLPAKRKDLRYLAGYSDSTTRIPMCDALEALGVSPEQFVKKAKK